MRLIPSIILGCEWINVGACILEANVVLHLLNLSVRRPKRAFSPESRPDLAIERLTCSCRVGSKRAYRASERHVHNVRNPYCADGVHLSSRNADL